MVHIPAKFRENTSMRFRVTVRKLNVTDGWTDGCNISHPRTYGAAGDTNPVVLKFGYMIQGQLGCSFNSHIFSHVFNLLISSMNQIDTCLLLLIFRDLIQS